MVFEFVMWPCLCYPNYINVAKADKVIEFVRFAHGNAHGLNMVIQKLRFYAMAVGLVAGTSIMSGLRKQVGALNLDHMTPWMVSPLSLFSRRALSS